ncbi:MAG: VTT domain-containing protein [Opitutaceae bacterium]|jgi:uncharacterized membrane protein YdjX (TVP38/TMEM64 family)
MPSAEASLPAVYKKRRQFIAAGGIALAVLSILIAILCNAGFHVRETVGCLRNAGPWAFFAAMALLPAIGFPLAVFMFAAGPAFAESLGLGQVLLLASAAIATNVALAYWLARYALRPFVIRLLAYLGYPIPALSTRHHLSVAFLVRVTPGPPFFLQNCLLGLAGIPFLTYMFASWSVASAYAAAAIIGGDALMRGDVRAGLFALALLGTLAITVKMLRNRVG